MTKVLVFAFDALDSKLLSEYKASLPNLSSLKRVNPNIKLECIYPPDTPTIWASIYTGLNPAKHGIVYFVDPLEKLSVFSTQDLDNKTVKGNTFWDITSNDGKKVCILFPQLGYPVWQVKGVMVGKSTQRYNKKIKIVQSFPETLENEFDFSRLTPIKSAPQKKRFPEYIKAYKELLDAEIEFGLKLYKKDRWDIFFIYSSALDWLGHNMWSYFDAEDPSYPGKNQYQDLLKDFYSRYDRFVGEFMDISDSETTIIVLSDHGMTRRPSWLVNINEILRREGLLISKLKRKNIKDKVYLLEVFKKKAAEVVNKYGAGPITMRIIHKLPSVRQMFTRPRSIDWENTAAYVSDLSGIKSYSYGGIVITKENLKGQDYEETRSKIIGLLTENLQIGRLIKWIRRREELYSGEYLFKYPDIIFQLKDDYGVGWGVYEDLICKCLTHNIQPGSHNAETPVFLISNADGRKVMRKHITMMDIAPTILDLLNIRGNHIFEGNSIFMK